MHQSLVLFGGRVYERVQELPSHLPERLLGKVPVHMEEFLHAYFLRDRLFGCFQARLAFLQLRQQRAATMAVQGGARHEARWGSAWRKVWPSTKQGAARHKARWGKHGAPPQTGESSHALLARDARQGRVTAPKRKSSQGPTTSVVCT
eukprot:362571-Chlamydomonas_euryale.AAC.1